LRGNGPPRPGQGGSRRRRPGLLDAGAELDAIFATKLWRWA